MTKQIVLVFALAASVSAQPARNDYADVRNWLCLPGRQDACAVDQATTIVSADGKLTRENWKADPTAPIDCFYVYPTVSTDSGGNSDMIAGAEENGVVRAQVARFASQCRVYAPLYRQATLTALRAATTASPIAVDRTLAYNDVVDAWNSYLQRDNNGRGVVLIGHSQGAGVLTQLIRNEIDGKPVQSRLVSALLLGTNLAVPKGQDVGGAFLNIPLCRSVKQVGCAIAYVSFRATVPPPGNSRFGRVQDETMMAACTNPAALGGGRGELRAYLVTNSRSIVGSSSQPRPWVTPPEMIDTPFVSVPGLLTAECVSNEQGSYLAVTVHANPLDPRTDDIAGDVMTNGQVNASWGLHLIDVQVAMGNLVDSVREQARAFASTRRGSRPTRDRR
jgi:Protein of unknown function (DUF3089)